MNHKKQAKMNIPMCLAGVLLCLTLISLHFTSGFYAKYTASGQGEDDARVAKFSLTEEWEMQSETLQVAIAPSDNGAAYTASVKVKNDSEVAMKYSLDIENVTGNIPLEITLVPDEEELSIASGDIKEYEIRVMWSSEDALNYMGMVDLIKVTVEAVQID